NRAQGARAGRRRRMGRTRQRPATGGGKTMKKTNAARTAFHAACWALVLWLAGSGLAAAQNSLEAFDVIQQGDKLVVRMTTKEPLRSVPPNFTVANPARIAFDFANTVNGLGRTTQD